MFLKVYAKEGTLASLAGGVSEKTYRKWVWLFLPKIAKLEASMVRIFLFFV